MSENGRLLSLDVLRGITIVGMITVNTASYIAALDQFQDFPILEHSEWAGFTLADSVFPAFVFMTGASIPLAFARSRAEGLTAATGRRIFWRVVRLFLLGLLVSNLYFLADWHANLFRPFGVLQRLALVYGFAAVLYLTCGWRTLLGIAAGILLLYWPLSFLPALDHLPNDIWQKGHNFVGSVDRVLLGAHIYVKGPAGYDPEGILGTLPAIAQGLIGVLAGQYLLSHRGARAAARLITAGAVLAAVGGAWGFVFPVIKDIWSSSYVLLSSGLTLMALGLLHLVLDREGAKPTFITTFFVAFGINAVAAYVYHELASLITTGDVFKLPYRLAEPYIGGPAAELIPVFMFVLVIWSPMEYMRRRGWIIRT
jgi:predicted acyltransferase